MVYQYDKLFGYGWWMTSILTITQLQLWHQRRIQPIQPDWAPALARGRPRPAKPRQTPRRMQILWSPRTMRPLGMSFVRTLLAPGESSVLDSDDELDAIAGFSAKVNPRGRVMQQHKHLSFEAPTSKFDKERHKPVFVNQSFGFSYHHEVNKSLL